MKKLIFAVVPALAILTACSTGNNYFAKRNSTVEMYHIFNIKTAATTSEVAKAAADALTQNTSDVSQTQPLQIGVAVPEAPGRFVLDGTGAKPAGTAAGAPMQMSQMQGGGAGMKAPSCNGAAWTARAQRNITGANNLTLYSCLYKYQAGYELDTYAVFQKTQGGIAQISRSIAHSLVGTPEQWVNKTIMDMVRAIETKTAAEITHVEGQPDLNDLPSGALFGAH